MSFDLSKIDYNNDIISQFESPNRRPHGESKKVLIFNRRQLLIVYNRAYEC